MNKEWAAMQLLGLAGPDLQADLSTTLGTSSQTLHPWQVQISELNTLVVGESTELSPVESS